jgi:mRNA interferase RelE/StbE
MYSIELTRNATRELRRLNNPILGWLLATIEELGGNPRPQGSKKLVGNDELWRVRVGDYRIVYLIADAIRIITITRVAHRKDVYDNL